MTEEKKWPLNEWRRGFNVPNIDALSSMDFANLNQSLNHITKEVQEDRLELYGCDKQKLNEELVDALMICMSTLTRLGADIQGMVNEKLKKNEGREKVTG